MLPRPTIEALVVIGGSALALLGVTDRQTRDFDILHPEPDHVRATLDDLRKRLGHGV